MHATTSTNKVKQNVCEIKFSCQPDMSWHRLTLANDVRGAAEGVDRARDALNIN